MKKTLALVLALIMVLALVPAAFAANDLHTIAPGEYEVSVQFTSNKADSVDTNYLKTGTFTAKGTSPAVVVTAPYNNIDAQTNGGNIWASRLPVLQITVKGFGGAEKFWNNVAGTVTVNGTKLTVGTQPGDSTYQWVSNDTIVFNSQITSASATYSYNVVLSYLDTTKTPNVQYTETMNFTVQYVNNQKPVYELKFNQPDTAGVVLKDGVYFIDSANSSISPIDSFAVNVAKNDGSKFTEIAYYAQDSAAYPKMESVYATDGKHQVTSDSKLNILPAAMNAKVMDTAKTAYVVVETEYAFYKGTLTYKYRTNVTRVDPKGISFAKSEYTIGKNEVLTPTYTSVATVYHDLADYTKLELFGNSDQNVIDVDGKKITGLKDGTVYVKATYTDPDLKDLKGNAITYTDTVKITVTGEYKVTDKANYKVTTKSGNLNVRASASTSAKKIGSLKKGDVVEVVEIKNGWAKIIYPAANYTNGYVSAQYLTKEATSPAPAPVGTKTVIARVLNVRSGAGTSYSIVGKLTRNTKVEVIETVASGKWAKIKFNDSYAYVSCTYLQ